MHLKIYSLAVVLVFAASGGIINSTACFAKTECADKWNMGENYDFGISVEADKKRAEHFYEQQILADQQCTTSTEIDPCTNKRVTLSNEQAQVFAYLGDSKASYLLGFRSANGIGTPTDLSQAFQWYSRSAELGNRDAEFRLGQMYRTGSATKKDLTKAMELYARAARKGLTVARTEIANLEHPASVERPASLVPFAETADSANP